MKEFTIDIAEVLAHNQNYKEYRLLQWFSHQFDGSVFFEAGTSFGESGTALADNPTNLVITYDLVPPRTWVPKHKDSAMPMLFNMIPKLGDILEINIEWIANIDLIYLDTYHEGDEHERFIKRIEPYFKGILIVDAIDEERRYGPLYRFWNNWDRETHTLPRCVSGPRGTGVVPYGDWTVVIKGV